MIKFYFGILLSLTMLSCVGTECRRKESIPPLPGVVSEPSQAEVKIASGAAVVPIAERRVLIYKYDGSLQCSGGRGISVKEMKKELADIKVFSEIKKTDGLMHIQVCGANTGMANVYEILATDLKEAEKRGFKAWKFE